MAKQTTEQIPASTKATEYRTRRIEISCEKGLPYVARMYRQKIVTLDGAVIMDDREFDVIEKEFPLDGAGLTQQELAALGAVQSLCDTYGAASGKEV